MAESIIMPKARTGAWTTEVDETRCQGQTVSSRVVARMLAATGTARHDAGAPSDFRLHMLDEGRYRADLRPPRENALSEDIYADDDGGAVLHARQYEDHLVAVAHGEWNESACFNLADCLVRALDAGCRTFILDLGCPGALPPGARAVVESLSRCLAREGLSADIRLCPSDAT